MLQHFEVGQACYPPDGADGVIFQMDDAGGLLVLKMNRPPAKETRNYKNGVAQFRVAVVADIVFLLVRFGQGPWMDAPFYRGLAPNLTNLQTMTDTQGIAVMYHFVDSSTGILLSQRLIGLEHNVSVRLGGAIYAQPEIPDYGARLQLVLSQYTTDDLVEISRLQDRH